jgi:hypothetical protein
MLRLDLQLTMIVVITALVSLNMFVFMPDSFKDKPCGDCRGGYIIPAMNLIEGKGLVDNNEFISITRPPGSPIIIAGLLYVQRWLDLPQQKVFWMFNSLMIAFSAILILMISQLIWRSKMQCGCPMSGSLTPFPYGLLINHIQKYHISLLRSLRSICSCCLSDETAEGIGYMG